MRVELGEPAAAQLVDRSGSLGHEASLGDACRGNASVVTDDHDRPSESSGSTGEIVAWLGAGALLLLAAVPSAQVADAGSGAERAGRVVGTLVAAVGIALLLRLLWVLLIRRRAGLRVWSPWLLVVAAVVALMSGAGQAAQEDATRAPAAAGGSAGGRG